MENNLFRSMTKNKVMRLGAVFFLVVALALFSILFVTLSIAPLADDSAYAASARFVQSGNEKNISSFTPGGVTALSGTNTSELSASDFYVYADSGNASDFKWMNESAWGYQDFDCGSDKAFVYFLQFNFTDNLLVAVQQHRVSAYFYCESCFDDGINDESGAMFQVILPSSDSVPTNAWVSDSRGGDSASWSNTTNSIYAPGWSNADGDRTFTWGEEKYSSSYLINSSATGVRLVFGAISDWALDGGFKNIKLKFYTNLSNDISVNNSSYGTVSQPSVTASTSNASTEVTAEPKDGYIFSSWTKNGFVSAPSSTATASSGSITITAGNMTPTSNAVANFSAITYTIAFNMNYPSGVSSGGSKPSNKTVTGNASSDVLGSATLTNFIFVGWMLKSTSTFASFYGDGTMRPCDVNNAKAASITINLYALWQAAKPSYSGELTSSNTTVQSISGDSAYRLYEDLKITTSATKTGHTLVGIYATYKSGELTDHTIALEKVSTYWVLYGVCGNFELSAVWKANSYTITYYVGSTAVSPGSSSSSWTIPSDAPSVALHGTTVNFRALFPTCSNSNYIFKGWSTTNGGSTYLGAKTVTGNISAYVAYATSNIDGSYNSGWTASSGSGPSSTNNGDGKSGFGWAKKSNGDHDDSYYSYKDISFSSFSDLQNYGAKTIAVTFGYACYARCYSTFADSLSNTAYFFGGISNTSVSSYSSVPSGSKTSRSVTATGTSQQQNINSFTLTLSIVTASSFRIWLGARLVIDDAKWNCYPASYITSLSFKVTTTANTAYTVTFNFNENGNSSTTVTTKLLSSGSTTVPYPSINRTGYQFLGWNTSQGANTSNKNAETSSGSISSNTIYYAIWKINKYPIITYDVFTDGTNYSTSIRDEWYVEHGNTINLNNTNNSNTSYTTGNLYPKAGGNTEDYKGFTSSGASYKITNRGTSPHTNTWYRGLSGTSYSAYATFSSVTGATWGFYQWNMDAPTGSVVSNPTVNYGNAVRLDNLVSLSHGDPKATTTIGSWQTNAADKSFYIAGDPTLYAVAETGRYSYLVTAVTTRSSSTTGATVTLTKTSTYADDAHSPYVTINALKLKLNAPTTSTLAYNGEVQDFLYTTTIDSSQYVGDALTSAQGVFAEERNIGGSGHPWYWSASGNNSGIWCGVAIQQGALGYTSTMGATYYTQIGAPQFRDAGTYWVNLIYIRRYLTGIVDTANANYVWTASASAEGTNKQTISAGAVGDNGTVSATITPKNGFDLYAFYTYKTFGAVGDPEKIAVNMDSEGYDFASCDPTYWYLGISGLFSSDMEVYASTLLSGLYRDKTGMYNAAGLYDVGMTLDNTVFPARLLNNYGCTVSAVDYTSLASGNIKLYFYDASGTKISNNGYTFLSSTSWSAYDAANSNGRKNYEIKPREVVFSVLTDTFTYNGRGQGPLIRLDDENSNMLSAAEQAALAAEYGAYFNFYFYGIAMPAGWSGMTPAEQSAYVTANIGSKYIINVGDNVYVDGVWNTWIQLLETHAGAYGIILVGAAYADYAPVGSPVVGSIGSYYEAYAYQKTKDTAINNAKSYYTLTPSAVGSPNGDGLKDYFEYDSVNGIYRKTTDNTVQSKTYYTLNSTKVASPVVGSIGSYYEILNYGKTRDTAIAGGKNYFSISSFHENDSYAIENGYLDVAWTINKRTITTTDAKTSALFGDINFGGTGFTFTEIVAGDLVTFTVATTYSGGVAGSSTGFIRYQGLTSSTQIANGQTYRNYGTHVGTYTTTISAPLRVGGTSQTGLFGNAYSTDYAISGDSVSSTLEVVFRTVNHAITYTIDGGANFVAEKPNGTYDWTYNGAQKGVRIVLTNFYQANFATQDIAYPGGKTSDELAKILIPSVTATLPGRGEIEGLLNTDSMTVDKEPGELLPSATSVEGTGSITYEVLRTDVTSVTVTFNAVTSIHYVYNSVAYSNFHLGANINVSFTIVPKTVNLTWARYDQVFSPSGNPTTQPYYELSAGVFSQSEDSSVNGNKTYYIRTVINSLNPSVLYDATTHYMVATLTGGATSGGDGLVYTADLAGLSLTLGGTYYNANVPESSDHYTAEVTQLSGNYILPENNTVNARTLNWAIDRRNFSMSVSGAGTSTKYTGNPYEVTLSFLPDSSDGKTVPVVISDFSANVSGAVGVTFTLSSIDNPSSAISINTTGNSPKIYATDVGRYSFSYSAGNNGIDVERNWKLTGSYNSSSTSTGYLFVIVPQVLQINWTNNTDTAVYDTTNKESSLVSHTYTSTAGGATNATVLDALELTYTYYWVAASDTTDHIVHQGSYDIVVTGVNNSNFVLADAELTGWYTTYHDGQYSDYFKANTTAEATYTHNATITPRPITLSLDAIPDVIYDGQSHGLDLADVYETKARSQLYEIDRNDYTLTGTGSAQIYVGEYEFTVDGFTRTTAPDYYCDYTINGGSATINWNITQRPLGVKFVPYNIEYENQEGKDFDPNATYYTRDAEQAVYYVSAGASVGDAIPADSYYEYSDCTYTSTEDVSIVPGKTYFVAQYEEVASPVATQLQAYYELISKDTYSLTEDTVLNGGKTYYNKKFVPVSAPEVGSIGSYYDYNAGSYTLTEDTTVQSGKYYYTKVLVHTYTAVVGPTEANLATYYLPKHPVYDGAEHGYLFMLTNLVNGEYLALRFSTSGVTISNALYNTKGYIKSYAAGATALHGVDADSYSVSGMSIANVVNEGVTFYASNYRLPDISEITWTIDRRPIAVSWDNTSLVYRASEYDTANDGPVATINNVVSGDEGKINVSTYGGTSSYTNARSDMPISVTAISGDRSGNYTLIGGTGLSDTWTIAPKVVSLVSWAGEGAGWTDDEGDPSIVYDGSAHRIVATPTSGAAADNDGKVYAGDAAGFLFTYLSSSPNVLNATIAGDYQSSVSGCNNANYTVSAGVNTTKEWHITARPLTATVSYDGGSNTHVYDATDHSLTILISGFVSTDYSSNISFTYSSGTTTPGDATQPNATSVSKTFSAKAYGDYTVSVSIADSAPRKDCYTLTGSTSGTFSITKRTVSLTWTMSGEGENDFSAVYDGTEKVISATVNNLADEEDVVFVTVTSGAQTNFGSYTATASGLTGSSANNYILPTPAPTRSFDITKRALTASWTSTGTFTYDGQYKGETLTIGNVIAKDAISFSVQYKTVGYDGDNLGPAVVVSKSAGSGTSVRTVEFAPAAFEKTIDVGTYFVILSTTLSGTDSANYSYTPSNENDRASYTIEAKELTLSGTWTWTNGGNSGTYNNETNLIYNHAAYTFTTTIADDVAVTRANTGVVDSLSLTYSNNVATHVSESGTAQVSGITGTYAGNYVLPSSRSLSYAIHEKPVAIVWSNYSGIVYDGATHRVTATVGSGASSDNDGLAYTGDTVNVTISSAEGKNAGSYVSTASSLDNTDYAVGSSGTLNWSIAQRPVSLTWSADNLEYDGTAQSVTADVSNIVTGDTLTLTYSGNTQTNVGDYVYLDAEHDTSAKVTALGGATEANYTLTGGTNIAHDWHITPIVLEFSWSGGANLAYNKTSLGVLLTIDKIADADLDDTERLSFTTTVPAGVTTTHDESIYTISFTAINAGDYAVSVTTITGTSRGNYSLPNNVSNSISIAQRVVTVSWTSANVTYDHSSHNASASVTNLCADDSVNLSYQTIGDATSYSVSGTNGVGNIATHADRYTTSITGVDDTNYTISGATGLSREWTISPKALTAFTYQLDGAAVAPVTYNGATHTVTATVATAATATNDGKTYTGDTVTLTYSGAINTNYGASSIVNNVATAAGEYRITIASTGNSDYSVAGQYVDITISRRTLTVTITNITSSSYVYDGSAQGKRVTLGNIVAGDNDNTNLALTPDFAQTVSVATRSGTTMYRDFTAINAGSYSGAAVLSGAKSANYALETAVSINFTIAPKEINTAIVANTSTDTFTYAARAVTANDLGVSFTTLITGEALAADTDFAVSYKQSGTPIAAPSNVGTYTAVISLTGTTAASNYTLVGTTEFDFEVIPYTITSSMITWKVSGSTVSLNGMVYSNSNKTLTATISDPVYAVNGNKTIGYKYFGFCNGAVNQSYAEFSADAGHTDHQWLLDDGNFRTVGPIHAGTYWVVLSLENGDAANFRFDDEYFTGYADTTHFTTSAGETYLTWYNDPSHHAIATALPELGDRVACVTFGINRAELGAEVVATPSSLPYKGSYYLPGAHVKTEDVTLNAQKTYYTGAFNIVSTPDAEFLSTYYEYVAGEFVLTEDNSIDVDKTYYAGLFTVVSDPDVSDIGTYYEYLGLPYINAKAGGAEILVEINSSLYSYAAYTSTNIVKNAGTYTIRIYDANASGAGTITGCDFFSDGAVFESVTELTITKSKITITDSRTDENAWSKTYDKTTPYTTFTYPTGVTFDKDVVSNGVLSGTSVTITAAFANYNAAQGAYVLTADTALNGSKIYYTPLYRTVYSPFVGDIATYYEEVSTGVYELTDDIAIDGSKTYYELVYNPIASPVVGDIGSYYEYIAGARALTFIIGGADASNYYLVFTSSENFVDENDVTVEGNSYTFDGRINPRLITSAGNAYKVYDGTDALVPFSYNSENILPGDSVTVMGTFASAEVGTWPINITTGNANYRISTTISAVGTINPKEITLTWVNSGNVTYDGTAHGVSLTIAGMVDGHEEALTVTGFNIANGTIAAGTTSVSYSATAAKTYSVTISLSSSPSNYVLVDTVEHPVSQSWTIAKKVLTITWTKDTLSDGAYIYNWTDYSVVYSAVERSVTPSISGVVSGDDVSFTKTNYVGTSVGNRTAEVTALTGEDCDNYALPAVTTQAWSITAANIVGVTMSDLNVVYNAHPQGPEVNRYTTQHGIALNATYSSDDDDDKSKTAETIVGYNARTNIGESTITVTLSADNYTTLVLTADVTVTKATITGIVLSNVVTTFDKTQKTMVVNRSTTQFGEAVDISYEISTDGVNFVSGNAATNVNVVGSVVRPYTVRATCDAGDNYNDLVLNATLTINKAAIQNTEVATLIHVTEDFGTITYDAEYHGVTIEVYNAADRAGTTNKTQYLDPVTITYHGGETGGTAKNVGVYEINAVVSAGDNYNDFTTEYSTLTIQAKEVAISYQSGTFTYNGRLQTPTVSITSGICAADEGSVRLEVAIAGTSGEALGDTVFRDAGTYRLTPSLSSSNYTIPVGSAYRDYTVNQAAITGYYFVGNTVNYNGSVRYLGVYSNNVAYMNNVTNVALLESDLGTVSYKYNTTAIDDPYVDSFSGAKYAGTYYIQATVNGGGNYITQVYTATLVINRVSLTGFALNDVVTTFDGSVKTLAVTVTNASQQVGINYYSAQGDLLTLTYTISDDGEEYASGNSRTNVNVNGSSEVTPYYIRLTFGLDDDDATGSYFANTLTYEATLTINRAALSGISFPGGTYVYDGTAHNVTPAVSTPGDGYPRYSLNAAKTVMTVQLSAAHNGGNGDTFTVTQTVSPGSEARDVGTYTFRLGVSFLSGTSANNYASYAGLTATVTITPAVMSNGEGEALVKGSTIFFGHADLEDPGLTYDALTHHLLVLSSAPANAAAATSTSAGATSYAIHPSLRPATNDTADINYTVNGAAGSGFKDAGEYTVTATLQHRNYTSVVLTATVVVSPASIDYYFVGKTDFVYDGVTHFAAVKSTNAYYDNGTVTQIDLCGSDKATVAYTYTSVRNGSGSFSGAVNADTYTITATITVLGGMGGNYSYWDEENEDNDMTVSLVIASYDSTVNWANTSTEFTYNGTARAGIITASFVGVNSSVIPLTISYLGTSGKANGNVVFKNAGAYTLTAYYDIPTAYNYNLSNTTLNKTIAKADVAYYLVNSSLAYSGVTKYLVLNSTNAGKVQNENLTTIRPFDEDIPVVYTYAKAGGTFDSYYDGESDEVITLTNGARNAGVYTVTANIDLSGLGGENSNYNAWAAAKSATLTISTILLTQAGGSFTKEYDGTTTIDNFGTVSGIVSADEDYLTINGTYNNKNVGVGKSIVFTLTPESNYDYLLANYVLPSTVTGTVTARALTVNDTLSYWQKFYDGTTSSPKNPLAITTSNRLVAGDVVTVTAVYNSKNVLAANRVSFLITGTDSGNYSLSALDFSDDVDFDETYLIIPLSAAIRWSSAETDYNGAVQPVTARIDVFGEDAVGTDGTLSLSLTLTRTHDGNGTLLSPAETSAAYRDAGTYTATASSGEIDANFIANYGITSTSETFVINKAVRTVSWTGLVSSYTYNGTDQSGSINASVTLLGTDVAAYSESTYVNLAFTQGGIGATFKNAGSYTLTVSLVDNVFDPDRLNNNYTLVNHTYERTIQKADIDNVAFSGSYSWTYYSGVTDYFFVVASGGTFARYESGDFGITTSFNYPYDAVAMPIVYAGGEVSHASVSGNNGVKNAGTYNVSASVAASDNYNSWSGSVTVTVNRGTIDNIVMSDITKTYNATRHGLYAYNGTVGGEAHEQSSYASVTTPDGESVTLSYAISSSEYYYSGYTIAYEATGNEVSATNAGIYSVSAYVLNHRNYVDYTVPNIVSANGTGAVLDIRQVISPVTWEYNNQSEPDFTYNATNQASTVRARIIRLEGGARNYYLTVSFALDPAVEVADALKTVFVVAGTYTATATVPNPDTAEYNLVRNNYFVNGAIDAEDTTPDQVSVNLTMKKYTVDIQWYYLTNHSGSGNLLYDPENPCVYDATTHGVKAEGLGLNDAVMEITTSGTFSHVDAGAFNAYVDEIVDGVDTLTLGGNEYELTYAMNYQLAHASLAWSIARRPVYLTLDPSSHLSKVYDGTGIFAFDAPSVTTHEEIDGTVTVTWTYVKDDAENDSSIVYSVNNVIAVDVDDISLPISEVLAAIENVNAAFATVSFNQMALNSNYIVMSDLSGIMINNADLITPRDVAIVFDPNASHVYNGETFSITYVYADGANSGLDGTFSLYNPNTDSPVSSLIGTNCFVGTMDIGDETDAGRYDINVALTTKDVNNVTNYNLTVSDDPTYQIKQRRLSVSYTNVLQSLQSAFVNVGSSIQYAESDLSDLSGENDGEKATALSSLVSTDGFVITIGQGWKSRTYTSYTLIPGSDVSESLPVTVNSANYVINNPVLQITYLQVVGDYSFTIADLDDLLHLDSDNAGLTEAYYTHGVGTLPTYTQTADISGLVENGYTVMPSIRSLRGDYVGGDHSISHINVIGNGTSAVGFFSSIIEGSVSNLKLYDIGVYSVGAVTEVGGFAGIVEEGVTVTNVTLYVNMLTYADYPGTTVQIGGFVGLNKGDLDTIVVVGKVDVSANAFATLYYGGAIGYAQSGTVETVTSFVDSSVFSSIALTGENFFQGGIVGGMANDWAENLSSYKYLAYANYAHDVSSALVRNSAFGTSSETANGQDFDALYADATVKAILDAYVIRSYLFATGCTGTTEHPIVMTNYRQLVLMLAYPYMAFRVNETIYSPIAYTTQQRGFFGTLTYATGKEIDADVPSDRDFFDAVKSTHVYIKQDPED